MWIWFPVVHYIQLKYFVMKKSSYTFERKQYKTGGYWFYIVWVRWACKLENLFVRDYYMFHGELLWRMFVFFYFEEHMKASSRLWWKKSRQGYHWLLWDNLACVSTFCPVYLVLYPVYSGRGRCGEVAGKGKTVYHSDWFLEAILWEPHPTGAKQQILSEKRTHLKIHSPATYTYTCIIVTECYS